MKARCDEMGLLTLSIESESELAFLRQILTDARRGGGSAVLGNDISAELPEEDELNEIIVPDVVSYFDEQVDGLEKALDDEVVIDGERVVLISGEGHQMWYGALNQARLQLEKEYQLSEVEDFSALVAEDENKARVYVRSQSYLELQSAVWNAMMIARNFKADEIADSEGEG